MTHIAELLDRLAPDEPVADRWSEIRTAAGVPARAGRRRALIAAIAVAVGALVVGTAAALHSTLFGDSSNRYGVFIAGDNTVAMRASVLACDGVIRLYGNNDPASGQVTPVAVQGMRPCRPGEQALPIDFVGGGDYVAGVVSPEVKRLVIVPAEGRPRFDARLVTAPPELGTKVRFFLERSDRIFFDRPEPSPFRALIGYDARGKVLIRLKIP